MLKSLIIFCQCPKLYLDSGKRKEQVNIHKLTRKLASGESRNEESYPPACCGEEFLGQNFEHVVHEKKDFMNFTVWFVF